MPRSRKQPKQKIVDGRVLLPVGDGTITGDLQAAANRLDEGAQIDKNSYTCRGRFPDPDEEKEYKEKRRLARRLHALARIFGKSQ